jgi:hypothetical protein
LADLVWDSAAALKPREYSLLDMHLRRSLSPEEIADATGVSKRNIYVNLFRLRQSLEKSVAGMLMMRHGRRECPDLNVILASAGSDELTPRVRGLLDRHVSECGRCQDMRRHIASLAFIPLPEESRIAIWNGVIVAVAAVGAGAGLLATLVGAPVRWAGDKVTGVQAVAITAAAVVTAGIIGGALVVMTGNSSSSPRDPDDVRSSTHRVGVVSPDNVIEIAWSRQSSSAGYSIEWRRGNARLPDQTADLPGDARGARSDPLEAGSWYFNLRTQNHDRRWTSTVHLGPFIIGPVAVAAPTPPSSTAGELPPPSPVVAGASASPVPQASSPQTSTTTVAGATSEAAPFPVPAGVPVPTAFPPPAQSPSPTGVPTPSPVISPGASPTVAPSLTATPGPTPEGVKVIIDILPDSADNKIHLLQDERVTVALLASEKFDPALADIESIRLLDAAPINAEFLDLNAENGVDLLLTFQVADMSLVHGHFEVCLTGSLQDGRPFQGCDEIRVVAQEQDGGEQGEPGGSEPAPLHFLLGLAVTSACVAVVVTRQSRRY